MLLRYLSLFAYLRLKRIYRALLPANHKVERNRNLYLGKKPDRRHPLYFLWESHPDEINSWIFHGESIQTLWNILNKRQPISIIETGSGFSTVVFAIYAKAMSEHFGKTVKILSVEHDEEWALKTESSLKKYALNQFVYMKICPIIESEYRGYFGKTYRLNNIGDMSFDFALIDGPPAKVGRSLTVLSITSLVERGGMIIVDDIQRKAEYDCLMIAKKIGLINIHGLSPVGNGLGILERI